nr:transposase [Novosphingobium sp. 9U]
MPAATVRDASWLRPDERRGLGLQGCAGPARHARHHAQGSACRQRLRQRRRCENLLWRGILPIIPPKVNRREPAICDFRRNRDRNHVERLFSRLKQSRRIATRYDKTASSEGVRWTWCRRAATG